MTVLIDSIFDTSPTGDDFASAACYGRHCDPSSNFTSDRWFYSTERDEGVAYELVDVYVNNWARGVSGLLTPVPIVVFNVTAGLVQIAGGMYENGSFALRKHEDSPEVKASLSIDRLTAIAHSFPPPRG